MTTPIRLVQFWDKPDPPAEVSALIATWAAAPGFDHHLFTCAQADAYITRHLGDRCSAAFRKCGVPAMQADFFRYCALFAEGGLYLDADTERGPEDFAEGLTALPSGLVMQRVANIANDVMFVRAPGHPLYRMTIDRACANIEAGQSNNVWAVTGPGIMTGLHRDPDAAALFEGLTLMSVREVKRWVRFRWQLDYKTGAEDWREMRSNGRSIYNA